jgi:hypothetical protein
VFHSNLLRLTTRFSVIPEDEDQLIGMTVATRLSRTKSHCKEARELEYQLLQLVETYAKIRELFSN